MSRRYRSPVRKKDIEVTVVNNHTLKVKTNKIPSRELDVIKKACHVSDRRKTFEIARTDSRELMRFADKFDIEPVPPHVVKVFHRKPENLFDESKVPQELWSTLFHYQKEGVKLIFNKYGGRALLADDMGLGKTRQALTFIGLSLHLSSSKRTLVVCPSYLRYHWQQNIQEWLSKESQLVKKGNELLEGDICIVSYDMLHKLGIGSGIFDIICCDESHYVKSRKTKRTKAITPLLKSARYALLITGTPALNRPIELFSQLYMLRPAYVKNYTAYAKRYCNGKTTPFGYDDRGSSNTHELNWVLNAAFMVRRLKRDVLTQLPSKTRHTVWLEVKTSDLSDVKPLFVKWKKLNDTIYRLPSGSEQQRQEMFERQKTISELFRATAAAKCKAVVTWVMQALSEGRSFIFFAYHKIILDAVEEAVLQGGLSYMRIDGSTPAHKRQAAVNDFQTDKHMRIAILSIMAAGTGITLTRVSECVMGELYWVPGVMIQAEDRIHRLSQTNKVNIQYLLGTETLDTYIHPTLCKKLRTLDTLVDKRSDRTFQGQTTVTVYQEDDDIFDTIKGLF